MDLRESPFPAVLMGAMHASWQPLGKLKSPGEKRSIERAARCAVSRAADIDAIDGIEDIEKCTNASAVVASSRLVRGALVEFRVELAADPVFHLDALVAEMSKMVEDFPSLFAAQNGATNFEQVQMIGKVIQRLLAGLIPIRARAVDYAVVEISGEEYAVHKDAIAGLRIASRPLYIVGVTEERAYWRDLRRVLFSNAEFTVLSRVARPGLQRTWTPVKLAELFKQVHPDLAFQISTASQTLFKNSHSPSTPSAQEMRLERALLVYWQSRLNATKTILSADETRFLHERIAELKSQAGSATGLRQAFGAIGSHLDALTGTTVHSERNHSLRGRARRISGLSLVPSLAQGETEADITSPVVPAPDDCRLLDVEIVAIYW